MIKERNLQPLPETTSVSSPFENTRGDKYLFPLDFMGYGIGLFEPLTFLRTP